MTFRELLKKSNHREVFNYLRQEYYYKNIDDEVHEMALSYQKVIDELLKKPVRPNKEWEIQILETEGEFEAVYWYNIDQDTSYGLDLTPWSEILDAQVQDSCSLNINERVAHLLYEITFYGFTEDQIIKQRENLSSQLDDIKEGKEKLISWEDITKEVAEEHNEGGSNSGLL